MNKQRDISSLPPMTGVAVPLGALRTESPGGVGTYTDLIPFISFCKKTGLKIIQLLPVNDTGTESSPYSALSAFALHPLYADIRAFPEAAATPGIDAELATVSGQYDCLKRFPYTELRNKKLAVLRKLYTLYSAEICKSDELKNWITENPWIEVYAVFMELKRQNNEASWKEWKPKQHPSHSEISERWNNLSLRTEHLFFAWLQMRLDQQFSKTAEFARKQGIVLKGDIPIMMNEDSCDTWAYPEFFNDRLRAGSPPDAENPSGQNWGFPIYHWDNLKRDAYSWWKNRLRHASKYYDAYRIDHVLGFFRIWAIPQTELSATLGYPVPNEPISLQELADTGFYPERVEWLAEPHLETQEIAKLYGGDYQKAQEILSVLMNRIGTEEMWMFKPEITGDRDIYAAAVPQPVKERLVQCWHDRSLIAVSAGYFMPAWSYTQSSAWHTLSYEEQRNLDWLIRGKEEHMKVMWETQARTLLGELTGCTGMIACAEDLGAMPESVPRVLSDLGILGLRVVRWYREWSRENQPFVPLNAYPLPCVATTSVHDSPTLRQWWLHDSAATVMANQMNLPPQIEPGVYTAQTAAALLQLCAKSTGIICIYPLQDLLHLSAAYYDENPEEERINIPGTVNPFNWTYRMPVSIETLSGDTQLKNAIAEIVKIHDKRKIS